MLLTQDIIKCVFFHSEEIGCVGSSQANMSWFKDVGYCLQGDRRGNTDFVNSISGELYSMCFAEDVAPIIAKYGYKESSGAITDVGQLAENGIGVCVANMSCGYYAPHSDKEIVQFHDANNCLDMIMHIVNDLVVLCIHTNTKMLGKIIMNGETLKEQAETIGLMMVIENQKLY